MPELTTAPPPDFLTVKQVAELLQCSERHIRNQVDAGLLKCFRIGKSIRFRRQSIEQWAARREH